MARRARDNRWHQRRLRGTYHPTLLELWSMAARTSPTLPLRITERMHRNVPSLSTQPCERVYTPVPVPISVLVPVLEIPKHEIYVELMGASQLNLIVLSVYDPPPLKCRAVRTSGCTSAG
jgi:hypothetical protein